MLVTVDIGNSRLKAARWQGGEMLEHAAQEYQRDSAGLLAQLQHFLQQPLFAQGVSRLLVACVAGEGVEQIFLQAVGSAQAALPEPVFFRTSAECCGIRHGYAQPSQHGVDRWAALIGSRKFCKGNVCVISIGTAITVDLLSAANRHLGGRIMPGLNMMLSALRQGVAGVAEEDEGKIVAFADNTADAVSSGVFHMLRAAVDEAIADGHHHREIGGSMQAFLTGGQASMLHLALAQANKIRLEPDLVLHGLQQVAELS